MTEVFDPATASWERRAKVAEALLRTLSIAVDGFARDNGGSLPHRINLSHSVASNHVRIMDNYEMSLVEAAAAKKADPERAAAIAACPTPIYHETHRYCPSCPWTEADDV